MRTTVRLDPSVTQTLPPPTAMPRPSAPVGIVSTTRPRTASILVTLRSSALVTQTRSAAEGERGRRHTDRNRLRPRGSSAGRSATRCRPASSPPRPRRPRPRSRSDRPRRRCAGDGTRPGIDARDGAVQRIRHPDRPFAGRDARRAVADRDIGHEPIRPHVDRRNRVCRGGAKPRAVPAGELDAGDGNRGRQEESGADRDQDAASRRARPRRSGRCRAGRARGPVAGSRARAPAAPAGLEPEFLCEQSCAPADTRRAPPPGDPSGRGRA